MNALRNRVRLGTFEIMGTLLLFQFVVMVIIKLATGLEQEIAWISHVTLLTAGFGLLLKVDLLVASSFVAIAVLHALWLADCFAWLATGSFPLGVTNYLEIADFWVWLSTVHHFFLLPILMIAVRRLQGWPAESLLLTVAIYLLLIVFSRGFLDRQLNVNYAFGVLTAIDHPLVHLANRLPGSIYLLGVVSFVTAFIFTPADMVGRRLVAAPNRPDKKTSSHKRTRELRAQGSTFTV